MVAKAAHYAKVSQVERRAERIGRQVGTLSAALEEMLKPGVAALVRHKAERLGIPIDRVADVIATGGVRDDVTCYLLGWGTVTLAAALDAFEERQATSAARILMAVNL